MSSSEGNNTYLIIGASGYLGSYFLKNILEKTNDHIIATYNSEPSIINERIKWLKLEITNFEEVDKFCEDLKKLHKELKVIYLSAYHHPDKVEENSKLAWNINIVCLANLLNKIPNIFTFYYSSTDNVYGESINNYHFKENDQCSPVNEYGQQKLLAEKIVLSYRQNVIRYPFLIGPSLTNKKHFYDFIVEDLKNDKKIEAFADSYRNSIEFNSAALYTINLIEKYGDKNLGIINICSDKGTSKYDVMIKIADKFGYNKENIIPVSIQKTNNIFKARRAKSTLMDNTKIKNLLLINNIDLK
jgi:dTDP-4-dehydrorhamnose reductase